MSDVPFCSSENACTEGGEQTNGCEPVCINVSRIYDSCGAKDCLSNLPVMFTEANQKIIDGACSVKISNVRIITSTVEVEPVAFHRGFYSVDMMYYFAVTVEAYTAAGAIPETVTGLAMYGKRVVLYGGEGCVKSFSSDKDVVCDTSDSDCPCRTFPNCVIDYLDGEPAQPETQRVLVTIGIFTITRLERDVQIMIPSYDFCVPRKECPSAPDDPCEVFSKIDFPTDSFFPPNAIHRGDRDSSHTSSFKCGCEN